MVRVGYRHARSPRFFPVVDSGSPYCMFKADLGRLIGLDVEKGIKHEIGGIIHGLTEPIYFHKVQIYVESDWVIEVMAGFVKKLAISGILGRNGFFSNFQVHFDHSGESPAFEISRIERPV